MAKIFNLVKDNLLSLVNGMGDPRRDKSAAAYYVRSFVDDRSLVAAYSSSWIAGKVIDIPADDAFRRGRDWQADMAAITAIEAEEKRLNIWPKIINAYKRARLLGGSALLIGTGEEDLASPLIPEAIGKGGLKYLTVLSRKVLAATELVEDVTSERFRQPVSFTLTATSGATFDIHPSRLVIFKGIEPLDEDLSISASLGWGDSVLERVFQAVKNGDGAASSISTMLYEANVDVINIPDFMASLSAPDYADRFNSRLSLAAAAKGVTGMLALDGEETYSRKTLSFASVPETLMALMQVVSGAADIPITRFLGQSPAGMNSTGEGDMKNYHDRIQSIQNLEITPAIALLDDCLVVSALGSKPADIYYSWSPLEQMNEKELSEIGKMNAETAQILTGAQIFTPDELRKVVANQMIENGFYPGLEDAMAETGNDWEGAFEPTEEEKALAAARLEAAKAGTVQAPPAVEGQGEAPAVVPPPDA